MIQSEVSFDMRGTSSCSYFLFPTTTAFRTHLLLGIKKKFSDNPVCVIPKLNLLAPHITCDILKLHGFLATQFASDEWKTGDIGSGAERWNKKWFSEGGAKKREFGR